MMKTMPVLGKKAIGDVKRLAQIKAGTRIKVSAVD